MLPSRWPAVAFHGSALDTDNGGRQRVVSMPTVSRFSLLRFSIRHLLIGTGLVALGCVSLRNASATWVAVVFALVLLSLTGSLLLLIFRQEEARAYWIGFALVIGLYLLVLSGGWGLDQNSHPLSPNNLITGRITKSCYQWLYSSGDLQIAAQPFFSSGGTSPGGNITLFKTVTNGPVPGGVPGAVSFTVTTVTGPTSAVPTLDDFLNVAHGLWALVLAACGGWFARWLYVTGPVAKRAAAGEQQGGEGAG